MKATCGGGGRVKVIGAGDEEEGKATVGGTGEGKASEHESAPASEIESSNAKVIFGDVKR